MAEKYCSTCFKTGEELDEALTKALECNDNAERAEAAAELAVKSASVAEESADIAEESKVAAERAKEDAEQARNEAQAIAGGEYLTLAGGTMTGPINLNPATAYIKSTSGSVSTYQCPAMFNVHALTNVGVIDINLGNKVYFHALDFTLASYSMNILLNMSGYGYVSSTTFHSPSATGICNGFVPKLRVAVDADGNRHWLLGEVDTNWGGYIRAGITKYIKVSGDHSTPNVSISFITDETDLFTWQKKVPIENIVPYDPKNLSAAVPIDKGGTGATTAEEARLALGVPSVAEMNAAIAAAIASALGSN